MDAYTVLCEEYKQVLIEKMKLSPSENRIYVVPNSEKSAETVNFNKKKQILYVGRMSYEDKRIDRLINIWEMIYEKVPDWELILVGDGEERESLQQMAQKKKLPRISLAGHSDHVAVDCSAGVHYILSPSGQNGILVTPYNLEEYARLLVELLTESENLKMMRQNVIRKAMEYAPDVIGDKWLRIFDSLLSSLGKCNKMENN